MAIKCEICGMEFEEDPGKFCSRCGRTLARFAVEPEPEDDRQKCLKCGHRNLADVKFCDNCGDLLRSPRLG